jgi:pimeloyl-ACP methyl ester carboxylesterase
MRACLVKTVNEDLSALLPQIKAPTLLVWGDKDTATPLADGQRMEREIPDAGLVTLEGAGHFSFLDQPYVYRAVLQSFLKIGAQS